MKVIFNDTTKLTTIADLDLNQLGLMLGLLGSFGMGAATTAKATLAVMALPPEGMEKFFNGLRAINKEIAKEFPDEPQRVVAVDMFIQVIETMGREGLSNLDAAIYSQPL